MLTKLKKTSAQAKGGRFAIVAARYNARYVDAMLRAAQATLREAGAVVEVIRVPGAFEIPAVASALAHRSSKVPEAILCLGVIIQGQTEHARLIGEGVTQALAQLQVICGMPVIHEVLLLADEKQAQARCLGREHNRGAEAAQTAVAMRAAMKSARG
jgi:6,7-dimethyl-8-ribityllumazine synthase